MNFISILEEQSAIGFTGRVNVLREESNESLGVILIKEGEIVYGRYNNFVGVDSLYRILVDHLDEALALQFVVEPELVSDGDSLFKININEFKKESSLYYAQVIRSRKLRPPSDVKILLNSDFLIDGPSTTSVEFSIMEIITEYSKVEDIYKNSSYVDYETTNALVSLRKKGALKVLGTR